MPEAVHCPICGRALPPRASGPRAFCSERCRAVDLGSWLDGRYRIGTSVEETEDEIMPKDKEDPEPSS